MSSYRISVCIRNYASKLTGSEFSKVIRCDPVATVVIPVVESCFLGLGGALDSIWKTTSFRMSLIMSFKMICVCFWTCFSLLIG